MRFSPAEILAIARPDGFDERTVEKVLHLAHLLKTSLTASVYASSNVPSSLRNSPTLDPTFSFLVALTPSGVSALPASEATNAPSKPCGSSPLGGRDPATYATIARA